ncbi:MAG: hypothetical protein UX29_C0004G0012 [Parcubacteria group bacterium GW2011_GWA2_46_10]|nr:MAG: hypothetical protein UX29_C0004G0012 [Parcubacteria group bacterium GW2011_GWA2_46_10]
MFLRSKLTSMRIGKDMSKVLFRASGLGQSDRPLKFYDYGR